MNWHPKSRIFYLPLLIISLFIFTAVMQNLTQGEISEEAPRTLETDVTKTSTAKHSSYIAQHLERIAPISETERQTLNEILNTERNAEELSGLSNEIDTSAGEIERLDFNRLEAHQPYTVDLSNFAGTPYAISWSDGEIFFTFDDTYDNDSYGTLLPSHDIQEFEDSLTTELLELPTRDSIRLSIIPTQNTELSIDIISPSVKTDEPASRDLTETGVYNRNSGAKYTSLSIVNRDKWGADPDSWDPYDQTNIDNPGRFVWQPYYHPVSRILVHHTATANNPPDPQAVVRSIYLYHTYTRGWGDIGYNFLIDQFGTIYEGKSGGDEVYGYHAYTEANAMSVGIALLGSFSSTEPTAAAKTALVKLMAEKSAFYGLELKASDGTLSSWLDSDITVFGHRDAWFWCYPGHPYFDNPYVCDSNEGWAISSTSCPGDYFEKLLRESITPRAQRYASQNYENIKSVVAQIDASVQNPHEPNVIIVRFDVPVNTPESEIEKFIPSNSGISEVIIEGNTAYIYVYDWDNGGVVVPPEDWDGYNAPETFFPPARGPDDRLSTLAKIFSLDEKVEFAEFIGERKLFPISE